MSGGPRILVFAYSDVGYECLTFLIENKENIVALYTHRDNPNEKIWFPSVEQLARANNIPVFFADYFATDAEQKEIRGLKPDLIFSFYYRNMIPDWILALPTLGRVQHARFAPAALPRARADQLGRSFTEKSKRA